MKPLRWAFIVFVSFAFTASASAWTWYSSFYYSTATPRVSRVDTSGQPNFVQLFNTFTIDASVELANIEFYAPSVAPMYVVDVRIGGVGSNAIYFRQWRPPSLVLTHPEFPFLVKVTIPRILLFPGTWSVSVATDNRYFDGPGFYATDAGAATAWMRLLTHGQITTPGSQGLMMRLSDSW